MGKRYVHSIWTPTTDQKNVIILQSRLVKTMSGSETALSAGSTSQREWRLMATLLRSSLHNLKAASMSSLLSLRFTAEHPQSYKYISLDALHPHKAPPPYGFQPSQTLSLLGIKCSNAWAYERHFTFTQQHSTPGFPRLISFHKIHLIYKSPHGVQ